MSRSPSAALTVRISSPSTVRDRAGLRDLVAAHHLVDADVHDRRRPGVREVLAGGPDERPAGHPLERLDARTEPAAAEQRAEPRAQRRHDGQPPEVRVLGALAARRSRGRPSSRSRRSRVYGNRVVVGGGVRARMHARSDSMSSDQAAIGRGGDPRGAPARGRRVRGAPPVPDRGARAGRPVPAARPHGPGRPRPGRGQGRARPPAPRLRDGDVHARRHDGARGLRRPRGPHRSG